MNKTKTGVSEILESQKAVTCQVQYMKDMILEISPHLEVVNQFWEEQGINLEKVTKTMTKDQVGFLICDWLEKKDELPQKVKKIEKRLFK